MRYLRAVLVVLVVAAFPAVALAHRAGTPAQKTALINAAGLRKTPARCLTAWVSTASRSWGAVYFTGLWGAGQRMPHGCARYAANGITILQLRSGRWRYVTAGSSFVTSGGRCVAPRVPKDVVKDFHLCG